MQSFFRRAAFLFITLLPLSTAASAQQVTVKMLEPIIPPPPKKLTFGEAMKALANTGGPSGPRKAPHIYYGALTQSVTLDGNLYPAGSLAEIVVRQLSATRQRISLCAIQGNGKSTGIRDAGQVSAVDASGATLPENAPHSGLIIVGSQAAAPTGALIRFNDVKVDTGVYAWVHPVDTPEIIYSPGDGEQSLIVRVDETVDNHRAYNHVFAGSVVQSTPMGGVTVPPGSPVSLVEGSSQDIMTGDPVVQITMSSITAGGRIIETDPTEIHVVTQNGIELSGDAGRFVITRGANLSVPQGTYLRFDHVKTRVGGGVSEDGSTFVPAQVEPGNTHSFTILSIKPGLSYDQTVTLLRQQKLPFTETKEPSKLHAGEHTSRLKIESSQWTAMVDFAENPDAESPAIVAQGVLFVMHIKSEEDRAKFHDQILTKYGRHDPPLKNAKYPSLEMWQSVDDTLMLFYRPYGGSTEAIAPNPGPTGDPDFGLVNTVVAAHAQAKAKALEWAKQLRESAPAKDTRSSDAPF
ncbi:MAG: hypothetical protein PW792_01675 [Acidobacteriaceae bacterium]|nr:hypothetical protein [Acidobacteriaceae bacterium]